MDKIFHQPLGGNEMPRFAGIATMMRLPHLQTAKGLDAAFVGVPLDIGTSLRAGTRFGPREIRAESVMIRPYNMATGAAPFDALQVADLGDVAINTYSIDKSMAIITAVSVVVFRFTWGASFYGLVERCILAPTAIWLAVLATATIVRERRATTGPAVAPGGSG